MIQTTLDMVILNGTKQAIIWELITLRGASGEEACQISGDG